METWVSQLTESQFLDLAHPFTCQSETPSDLFERHGPILLQPIVEAQNLGLALRQLVKCTLHFSTATDIQEFFFGAGLPMIPKAIQHAKDAIPFGPLERGIEGTHRVTDGQCLFDLDDTAIKLFCYALQ
jgi:hypothetical protein